MRGSVERVRAVIRGEMPDRAPLYELLRNDAVISHFAGQTLTVETAPEVVYRAYEPAVDATRPLVRLPEHERTILLEDGREQRYFRWTIWTEHRRYADAEAYAAEKRAYVDRFDPSWTAAGYLRSSRWLLADLFHWMADTPSVLHVVNLLNIWGLTLIGAALMLGVFTRAASVAGILLLGLYYVAHPPLVGFDQAIAEGSYLIVNKNVVEMVALLVLAITPGSGFAGRFSPRRSARWR